MSTDERRYRKRKRAEQEEETRRRITAAVVELHRTVGPARTKVTEVAELAGVSRMTVYNHFPTEADLIAACSAHWSARNPPPDPSAWTQESDQVGRLRRGLGELYAFYAQTNDMLGNVLRDAPIVEPLGTIMDERWGSYIETVVDVLGGADERAEVQDIESSKAELRAALRVVVDFGTWRLLRETTTGSEAAVDVAMAMLRGIAPWKDTSSTEP